MTFSGVIRRQLSLLYIFPKAGASVHFVPVRNFGIAARIVRSLLRLRYLLLGSVIGGGVTLSQTLHSWIEQLPDFSGLKTFLPNDEQTQNMLSALEDLSVSFHEKWTQSSDFLTDQVKFAREHFPSRGVRSIIDNLKRSDGGSGLVVDLSKGLFVFDGLSADDLQRRGLKLSSDKTKDDGACGIATTAIESAVNHSQTLDDAETESETEAEAGDPEKIKKLKDDIMQTQIKYQREIERLSRENEELRQLLLLRQEKSSRMRHAKKSLIDMYSEALDLLVDYDSSFSTQDHLPRVVVVGDQSSGKTSVLEMIARARIFPRGSGEMMTRTPVKVTLSEGPYHVAKFKDSNREFDLTREQDLVELRNEIEYRMKNSVKDGKTVSSEVIALTVNGPGLPRMVLVDLPGVISTVTTEMATETKDDIVAICRTYMENPNAIILCIQDGSVDAERSNVTDLVSSIDPNGKRTIVVLTKVDLAEQNLLNPNRIKKILEGKLFPMKALGYYAVVTGRGNTNDSINTIRKYEEKFFENCKLFKDGVLKPSQMTTQNMSLAVSECFWKMVKESIEQQADVFKAARFNLETEWKNTYPSLRELDRGELFDRARSEILDEITNLSQITFKQWEEAIQKKLWDKMVHYVFENIFLPASVAENHGTFNTIVDIRLKHWVDHQLPRKSIDAGWETLKEQFLRLMQQDVQSKDHDPIFEPLKNAVVEKAMKTHKWDSKAFEYLRVMQLNALDDHSVPNKKTWEEAAKFMESVLNDRFVNTSKILKELTGPSVIEQWLQWKSPKESQLKRQVVSEELKRILRVDPDRKPSLTAEEIVVIKNNLLSKGVDISSEELREFWHQLFRYEFIQQTLDCTRECKSLFFHYQKGFQDNEVDCSSVVLFWRVKQMLQITTNALRQQITNTEARRLEKEIKEVLLEWSENPIVKSQFIAGHRVELAEELKKVRLIQEKLEEFINALNNEKTTNS